MEEFYVRTIDHLPKLIAAFRKQSGMTQADVAMRMGITQQALSAIERNPEVVGFGRLLKLLSVLNVELIFRGRDTDPHDTGTEQGW